MIWLLSPDQPEATEFAPAMEEALRDATVASVLFATFGFAVVCTIGAIVAYTVEMLMTGSGVRAVVAAQKRSSERG
jgi:hypothetical protein